MNRTRLKRPLCTGALTPQFARSFAAATAVVGGTTLYQVTFQWSTLRRWLLKNLDKFCTNFDSLSSRHIVYKRVKTTSFFTGHFTFWFWPSECRLYLKVKKLYQVSVWFLNLRGMRVFWIGILHVHKFFFTLHDPCSRVCEFVSRRVFPVFLFTVWDVGREFSSTRILQDTNDFFF